MAKDPVYKGTDKHGKKKWQIQVSTGVKIGGKYQRIFETFHGTKTAARARMREIETDLAQGVDVRGGKQPFDSYAKSWLEEKRKQVSTRTITGYERQVKTLCDILGDTPLESISKPVVRETMNTVRARTKGRGGGAPSESSIKATWRVLHGIMECAADDDLIRRNPCSKKDAPKEAPRERRALNAEQYIQMLAAVDKSTEAAYKAYKDKEQHLKDTGHQNKERHALRGIHEAAYIQAVRIGLATGMRPSEIFALQWQHIDFANGCIHVEQATNTAHGGTKDTKSKAGKRDVYLLPQTLEALATWCTFQRTAALNLGIELGTKSWVVCSDTFTQTSHMNFTRWWNKWAVDNGFEGWEFYELRHTQATQLIHAGADLESIKTRMGHSSLAVTEIYAHAEKESQKRLASMLPKA